MSYQVLARKWRPADFSEVIGQKAAITVLQNSLDNERIHHAYLFTGTRGIGKTTIARILAKSLICEIGISAKPCNVCELCTAVNNGSCIDVIEIDAASKTKVEDTRAILDNLAYMPSMARFKIYIVDEVHMLSHHSFNALLKSLEEPAEHVKFLLATTDPQKLPITVLSRCIQFRLKVFTNADIVQQLQKILLQENKLFEGSALWQVALAAKGSMRDALSLLEQVIAFSENSKMISQANVCEVLGLPDAVSIINLLKAVIIGDIDRALVEVNNILSHSVDISIALQEMQMLLKNITILQLTPNFAQYNDIIANKDLLQEIANLASIEEIQLYYEIIVNGYKNLAFMPDLQVGFEMIILRMVAFKPVKLSVQQQIVPVELDIKDIKDIKDVESKNKQDQYLDSLKILQNVKISGLTKEIFENAIFEFVSHDQIKLIIDDQHKLLLTKNNVKNIQIELSNYFAKQIKLVTEFIHFSMHPNLMERTVKWQLNKKKQDFVNNNQAIHQLICNFDGKIEEINEE